MDDVVGHDACEHGEADPVVQAKCSEASFPRAAAYQTPMPARLYGGGTEHRLAQETLLGIGGVRAVRAYCKITERTPSTERTRMVPRMESARERVTTGSA